MSRNLIVGVFDSKTGGFVGIRHKFDSSYLFTEYHRDLGSTVAPLEEIEKCPVSDLKEDEGVTRCTGCDLFVTFRVTDKERGTGEWFHEQTSPCGERINLSQHGPYSKINNELFDYLECVTKRTKVEC